MADIQGLYSIGVVERDTGIGRDTLRVWERRYGFPEPLRNEKGERVYSESQLRRLQRIRRLLDQGMRPGKLLPLSEASLDELDAGLQTTTTAQTLDPIVTDMLAAIRSVDAGRIELLLREQYSRQGMQAFVLQTVNPLLHAVGEFWARGQLQIFQEHFLSQQLIRFLNAEIASMQKNAGKPLVMLATLPGEEHTLGLLMVAAMLASHGVSIVNLGGEVPMEQIGYAVKQFNVDVVGITFSGAYAYSSIRSHLLELRELIADDVDIWAGGEGVRRLRKLPDGVTKFTSLETLPL
ncbi:MAG: MerR family transcriptional regulator [Gammaproteobacteria bacterium]|jgi:MerR family transcriptional regulator, light-induced transcriptional regulator|nr:MerR family transcriptional regulator [Gammaproteobacteria bacterium]